MQRDLYDRLTNLYRVARGGSWMNFRNQCRTAERLSGDLHYSSFQTGFRCATSHHLKENHQ